MSAPEKILLVVLAALTLPALSAKAVSLLLSWTPSTGPYLLLKSTDYQHWLPAGVTMFDRLPMKSPEPAAFFRVVRYRDSVTLSWSPSLDNSAVGYCVYYGPDLQSLTNRVIVGNSLTATVTQLDPAGTYCFAADAYDTAGVEGDFSNVVCSKPADVAGLTLKQTYP